MQYINYYQSKIVDMCQMLTFYSPAFSRKVIDLTSGSC